ncbi:Hypothetical predicted protein [Octopus vulgaris]|nr:Hypothetical predicted protein [Octopus vulgaris]
MKIDAMSAGTETTTKKKKKKVHKSIVEKLQAGHRKNCLDDNLQALQMFARKRKAATSGHINEIMKNTSNSKKKFIFGKKHNAKKKKKVTKKSAFDESDFENFFKEYHGLKK